MTADFGTHLAYVDENGDHGLTRIDSNYPVFVLAFCLFKKSDYVNEICPDLQRLKLRYWGHDEAVLHEREIRKPNKNFLFLFDPHIRESFLNDLNEYVEKSKFLLIASVIKKKDLQDRYATPGNPYELALGFGLERLFFELKNLGQAAKVTPVVVEMRGKKEDAELELTFRRICNGANRFNQKLPFEFVMVSKAANSTGLQLADLFARPLGLKVLRPEQENRSYDIIEGKLRKSPSGVIKGWGLKVFP